MTSTCANCHAPRPLEARGLCKPCYEKARRMRLLSAFPARPHHDPRAAWRAYYWRNHDRLLATIRARYQARRAAVQEG